MRYSTTVVSNLSSCQTPVFPRDNSASRAVYIFFYGNTPLLFTPKRPLSYCMCQSMYAVPPSQWCTTAFHLPSKTLMRYDIVCFFVTRYCVRGGGGGVSRLAFERHSTLACRVTVLRTEQEVFTEKLKAEQARWVCVGGATAVVDCTYRVVHSTLIWSSCMERCFIVQVIRTINTLYSWFCFRPRRRVSLPPEAGFSPGSPCS